MYKTTSWNTGLAAERARHNLRLKGRPPGRKRQAASGKLQATSATKKTQLNSTKNYTE